MEARALLTEWDKVGGLQVRRGVTGISENHVNS